MMSFFAVNTNPNMYAQTLEAISNWNNSTGKSLVGTMREQRNQARLMSVGIPLDNNISSELDTTLNNTVAKTLIANDGAVDACMAVPSVTAIPNINQTAGLYINSTTPITTQTIGEYNPSTNKYNITSDKYINSGITIQTGAPMVPGSLAGSSYQNLIPPNLNATYISKNLSPATYTVDEAISEVERCNCKG
jgi:hypothetical protein